MHSIRCQIKETHQLIYFLKLNFSLLAVQRDLKTNSFYLKTANSCTIKLTLKFVLVRRSCVVFVIKTKIDTWLLLNNQFDWCYAVFVMILIMICYILLMKLYPVTLNLIWSQDPWFTCKIGKNCQFMDFNLPFLTYLSIFIYVRCIKLCIVWATRLAARVFTVLYCCKML
jgi:hypothetical protein